MKSRMLAVVLLAALARLAPAADGSVLSLTGRWRFQLDRADAGINERWFTRKLPDHIRLPGSLTEQGIGDDISTNTPWIGGIVDRSWFTAPEYAKYRRPGNMKVPYWLQPEKYYKGAAWYQRDIEVPKDWAGKRVVLFLERAHWETRVWLQKPLTKEPTLVGTNNSLATPQEYDLGQLPPGKHILTIRVDNRMIVDIGENSHAVSDHTQGNWNGIVGKIQLCATPLVWVEDLQVYPQVGKKSVKVKGRIGNASGRSGRGQVQLVAEGQSRQLDISWETNGCAFETECNVGDNTKGWDEFTPTLTQFTATLIGSDRRSVTFGFREISTDGTQISINGRKTFIRGTLECAIFPRTGHPPTEIGEWKRTISVAKAYGLNLFRFHSWCPPEAAFQAADELGFYFQIETCWPNQSTTLGDGKPVDDWSYLETYRILKTYGNHPSFVLMAHGNEPGGRNANAWLANYVNYHKALDPRRLWTSGSGWPQLPENQFHVAPDPRIQAWGAGLRSRINAQPPETQTDYAGYIRARPVPVISHEIGQWCVYPNFAEIRKYTGYLKPKNFEIFRDSLRAHGMGDLAKQFLLASGKLQTLCYKEDIESALRTPGMGGFQLLDLHDFPGQGTALVGVLDPFWEDKGYVTAKEFSQFCAPTVPLARFKKRVFTADEKLEAELEVAHFGTAPLVAAATNWKLVDDGGKVPASGALPGKDIAVGNGISVGKVSLALQNVPVPARYKFVLHVSPSNDKIGRGTPPTIENNWDLWVYPPKTDASIPAGITVANALNAESQRTLDAGGKVLLLIPPKQVRNATNAPVALGFSSIFWNTAWTGRQPPTTLGILCDPKHPLFADFPTDFHSNWQWWYLSHRASAMILDDLPRGLRPTVQVIDDWVTNRKLGLVVEAKVGRGKLLVCSIDLEHNLDSDPVARQFYASLLHYMASDRFKPRVAVNAEQIRRLGAD